MKLAFLAHRPELMEPLAETHGQEWSHLYRDWNSRLALDEFRTQRGDGRIPATLLLLDDHHLAGSVSLVYDDLPTHPQFNPWLASLFVFPKYRGRRLAAQLVAEARRQFTANGFDRFYLFTEARAPFFTRLGFQPIESSELNGHAITLMHS